MTTSALLNWGLVLGVVLGMTAYRDYRAAQARTPLPAPSVSLTGAQAAKWRSFPAFRDVVPVLLYHAIGGPPDYLSVPQTLFAQQMLALHLGGFHAVTLQQYRGWLEGWSSLPRNPILITFDDGTLSSYRGADAVLEQYGYRATMFVVPAWIPSHPDWALQWDELRSMQTSGRWQIQEHAGSGHKHITVDPAGDHGEFYAYRRFLPPAPGSNAHLESLAAYKKRVRQDVAWGEDQLATHLPGYQPLAFAVPYSNYGQRGTNDGRIPDFFLRMLHKTFPLVFDGDYLDTGPDRPHEVKGRFSSTLSYRMQQGPVMTVHQLYCRLRDFVFQLPVQDEYECAPRSPR